MCNFFQKLIIFFLPFILLLFLNTMFYFFIKNRTEFTNYSFNEILESKVAKLPINSKSIVIAGDSRAERQLIPSLIDSLTDFNSINVAYPSGDLMSVVPLLTNYNDSNIFVISASSWQINESNIGSEGLSLKCFLEYSYFHQLYLYRNNFSRYIISYLKLYKRVFRYYYPKYYLDAKSINEKGFYGRDGILTTDTIEIRGMIYRHPWYKKIDINGRRWNLFKKCVNELGKRESLIIIYEPPVSPIWKEMTEGTSIDKYEKEYIRRTDSLCNKYKNIVFLDFYNHSIDSLDNAKFYDVQHLNIDGAKIFSSIIANKIKELISHN